MKMIRPEQLRHLRQAYPTGTRVELVQMDDAQAPPTGTRGTVTGVDDTGTIQIELVDGSEVGLRFHPDVPGAAIVAPSKKYVAPVFENGVLKGFGLRR